jgi:hypothetical protein
MTKYICFAFLIQLQFTISLVESLATAFSGAQVSVWDNGMSPFVVHQLPCSYFVLETLFDDAYCADLFILLLALVQSFPLFKLEPFYTKRRAMQDLATRLSRDRYSRRLTAVAATILVRSNVHWIKF